jgi:hypothetical protein
MPTQPYDYDIAVGIYRVNQRCRLTFTSVLGLPNADLYDAPAAANQPLVNARAYAICPYRFGLPIKTPMPPHSV